MKNCILHFIKCIIKTKGSGARHRKLKHNVQDMLSIPQKLYRIGELVRYSPFSRQTIHNYTTMGLIQEAEWTPGGHRLYPESVFPRLTRIMQLKRSRTLSQIREMLAAEDVAGESRGRRAPDGAGLANSTGPTEQG